MEQFNINNWKHPKTIVTPQIEEDIKKYLSPETLNLYNKCDDMEIRERIKRTVEMLDLVDHLDVIGKELAKLDKPSIRTKDGLIYKDSHIILWEHDFSGIPYDISALRMYLLLSVIDACSDAHKNEYIKCSDHIINKKNDYRSPEDVIREIELYEEEYGLSVNFRKVFMSDISNSLREKIADAIFVFSTKSPKEMSFDEMNNKYIKWTKKRTTDRLKKIATTLYELRSKYTHVNVRAFLPTESKTSDTIDSKWKLLIKKEYDLDILLKEVIIEQANRILREKKE
jgi:hypothetical protein